MFSVVQQNVASGVKNTGSLTKKIGIRNKGNTCKDNEIKFRFLINHNCIFTFFNFPPLTTNVRLSVSLGQFQDPRAMASGTPFAH